MKFKITNQNGSSYIYDNRNNQVWYMDGNVVNYKIPEVFQKGHKLPPLKDNELYEMRISLGMKCNMQCKYCSQGSHDVKETIDLSLCDRLISVLIENNIVVTNNLAFWGGEPLLYWGYLERLIPVLRKLYPEVRFWLITNGTLLTKERVDFFNRYQVEIMVSHDAQGQSLRGADPLKRQKSFDAIKYAAKTNHGFSFNLVVNPRNLDVQNIYPYFRKVMGQEVPVNVEGIEKDFDNLQEEAKFTQQDLVTIFNNIVDGFEKQDENVIKLFANRVKNWVYWLFNRIEQGETHTKCGIDGNKKLTVNLKGEVLVCQNFCNETIGHLADIKHLRRENSLHFYGKTEACQNCPVLAPCSGGCPNMNETQHSLSCSREKVFHLATFCVAWLMLFSSRIKTIEPLQE